jgi:4-carboxymuconolactone decarboxylase
VEDMQKITTGRDKMGDFAPKFAELNEDVLFGQVWSREAELSPRDRSMITVSALISGGNLEQLPNHLKLAKENGVTKKRRLPRSLHNWLFTAGGRKRGLLSTARKKCLPRKYPHSFQPSSRLARHRTVGLRISP